MRLAGLVLTLLCAACRSASSVNDADARVGLAPTDAELADSGQPMALREEPELEWHASSVALEPDGRTSRLMLTLPRGARAFAVRSWLDDSTLSQSACFQLEDVRVDGEQAWVGDATTDDYGDYCTACRERVAVGAGYGFHVLPSGPDEALELAAVQLRVALRDCTTLTPLSAAGAGIDRLMFEYAAWAPPAAELELQLPVSIVIANANGLAAESVLLASALDRLRTTWAAAGIAIVVAAQVEIASSATPIRYTANDRAELVSLTRAARRALDAALVSRAWPVIVLTTCLQRSDTISGERTEPLALTPHIPGGFGKRDEPDQVLIAAERCEGLVPGPRFLDPDTLGAVLAHELGHYLGLYHVNEADGRQDTLTDTSPDQANLMQRFPSAAALVISAGQIRIARRHPVFVLAMR